MNKTHVIADQHSTLYIKKIKTNWEIIWNSKNSGWQTIGTHKTLAAAKQDAINLIKSN